MSFQKDLREEIKAVSPIIFWARKDMPPLIKNAFFKNERIFGRIKNRCDSVLLPQIPLNFPKHPKNVFLGEF